MRIATSARADRGWDPARTWAFVVGLLEWRDAEAFAPFPKEQRRDLALVEVLRGAGVPAEQIVYLQDRAATTARIEADFARLLSAAQAGDLLVLYFCGHGGKADDGSAYFASYDCGVRDNPGWVVDAIPAAIERHFGGSRALLLADCCHSGSLATAAIRHAKRVGYAVLASSLASEGSTGNWTFTEGVIAGLRGDAFVDADGSQGITLRELAGQIAGNMAFAEEQLSTFTVVGAFEADMVVAPARPRPNPQVGRRVEVLSEGEWYPAQVIDADGARLKVHYYGYDPSDDEWVTSEQVRAAVRPKYPVGSAVEVRWKNKWYPATIQAEQDGVHCIHYQDYSSDWDEWVSRDRIRAAQ